MRVWALTALCALLVALFTTAALLVSSPTRIPDYVEAFLLMCARRVTEGAPLYVDPLVGAQEYGAPPSRWYVGYALPFSALLAYFPGGLTAMRALCGVTWVGVLGLLARTTRPSTSRATEETLGFVPAALVVACLVVAAFRLTELAFAARPDVFAVALSTLSLRSALKRGRVGPAHSACFALAFCVKPSVWGLFAGVLVHQVLAARPGERGRRVAELFAPALAVVGAFALGLQVVSHGVWIEHYRMALLLSFHAHQLVDALVHRVPFVALPLVFCALSMWWARRRLDVTLLAAAFSGSLLVAMVGMGKSGAALNYMMEPLAISVLAIAAYAPRAMSHVSWWTFAAPVAVGLQVAWSAPVAIFDSFALFRFSGIQDRELDSLVAVCGTRSGGFALSNRPGVEWRLNRRIHVHALEFDHLVDVGLFPAQALVDDASRATCFVDLQPIRPEMRTPTTPEDAVPSVQEALAKRFVFAGTRNGLTVYLPRKD